MEKLRYLAYGSNLHPLRLRERVPSARPAGVVQLPAMALRFHKRSDDGSGKCDLIRADPSALSFAAIYTLDAAEKPLLDVVEGLGAGYELSWIDCRLDGRNCRAFAYAASRSHVDPQLRPYAWYRELVLAGARFHCLPEDYVAAIAAIDCAADPDSQRHAQHQALLSRMARFQAE